MKLLDTSVLLGPTLRFHSTNVGKSLLGFSTPEDDALLIAGLTEALSLASVAGSRGRTVKRQRRDFDNLKEEHGSHFDRAYRMSYESFMKLHKAMCSLSVVERAVSVCPFETNWTGQSSSCMKYLVLDLELFLSSSSFQFRQKEASTHALSLMSLGSNSFFLNRIPRDFVPCRYRGSLADYASI